MIISFISQILQCLLTCFTNEISNYDFPQIPSQIKFEPVRLIEIKELRKLKDLGTISNADFCFHMVVICLPRTLIYKKNV